MPKFQQKKFQDTRGQARRALKIDGEENLRQTVLASLGSVVWFTPAMDRLFLESPGARRPFLDRLVFGFDPSHAEHISRYNRHMASRLKILKENGASDWLDLEEEQAADMAVKMLEARQHYLHRVAAHLPEVRLKLTGPGERVLRDEADPRAAIARHLKEHREKDRLLGATGWGAHRSELTGKLILTEEEREIPLDRASTGQHKRAILHLLMGHAALLKAEKNNAPVVLFDEVTAHLDPAVRAHVFATLHALGAQVWVSGTERGLFTDLPEGTLFFEVTGGQLSAAA